MLNHWGKIAAAAGIYLFSDGDKQDNERDKYANIPEWEKQKKAIIPIPWSKEYYGRFPLSHEFAPIFNGGARLAAMLISDNYDATDFAAGMVNDVFDALDPIGINVDPKNPAKGLLKILIPSIGHPIYEIAFNEKFTGAKIHPENIGEANKPSSQLYKEDVMPVFRDMAIGLNRLAGGTNNRVGIKHLDINPHNIQHFLVGYAGGLGSLTEQGWGISYAKSKGEDVDITRYPGVDIFARRISPSQDKYKANEMLKSTQGYYADWLELENSNSENAYEEAEKILDRDYGYIKFYEEASSIAREVKADNKDKREGNLEGEENTIAFSKTVAAFDKVMRLQKRLEKTSSEKGREEIKEHIDKILDGLPEHLE